ncbi:hypothetical protein B0H63DRAFT_106208 [Podospora didyma]|uniref:Uncharacterized protein n=1 Tax=Podospora didyma TaxID=330526 RepID=A0AAE0NYH8_9PEZI|nr:hypothetical protein B0H63DRAFT_106208 [Podospora didyma]
MTKQSPPKIWQKIVELYSALRLSKETDRLPALSGIASKAKPHLGNYFAGLWDSTFASDLLWRVSQLEVGTNPSGNIQGPLVVLDVCCGEVSYWDDLLVEITRPEIHGWERRKPRFIFCSATPAGRNSLGEVTPDSEVIIQGYLMPVTLQYVWTRPRLTQDSRAREHEPLKYEVHFGLDLPLLADHVLSELAPQHLPDKSELCMLLVHPDVCLVLALAGTGLNDRIGYVTYRRFGFVRQPTAYSQIYSGAVDWMVGSMGESIRIV